MSKVVKPLQGIRVLDITEVWSGPLCAQYLADMGAQVIRVSGGDRARIFDARRLVPSSDQFPGFPYSLLTRNRLGLSLDISKPEAVQLLKRLVGISDILLENSTPQTFRKFGLTYDVLREINPTLVMLSLSGAGQTGPWSSFGTYGPSLCALYGVSSLLNYPGEEWPREGASESDPISGAFGFIAIMAALMSREQTGKGQYIDLAQGEAILALASEGVLEYTMNHQLPVPRGNQHPLMAPHGIYPCQGEDRWISISVETEDEWHALCELMENPSWTSEPSFIMLEARLLNQEQLDCHISDWTQHYNRDGLTSLLQNAGIAAFPVLNLSEQFNDPHIQMRKNKLVVEGPLKPLDIGYGIPWKLSETPGTIYSPSPKIGEHDRYILRELLDVSDQDIEELIKGRIIG